MQVPVCPELTSAAVVRGLWLRPQPPLMDNSAPFPTRPLALIYRGHSVQTYRATSVWALDTTTIRMARGFVYLTAVVDVYSRRILAHRTAITLEAVHAVEAL